MKTKPKTTRPAKLPEGSWNDHRLTVVLPIPDYALSPNGRPHWARKAKAVKAARHRGTLETMALVGAQPRPCPVAYTLRYYWPSTHRDDDNAIASAKSYLDAICNVLGIDDRHVRFRALEHHADRKAPRLEVVMHLAE